IGINTLLVGAGLLLTLVFDIGIAPQRMPDPFDFSFSIFPVVFHANELLAAVAIPIVLFGLFAFFRFTNIGIAVRASAERADRAFLLGIPVKRIHTIVWVLATMLATLGMILRAGVVSMPIGRPLGPSILLTALAAAAIGRMERLPTIFFASIGLGILGQAIVFNGNSLLVEPIMFPVILITLLLQRRGQAGRAQEMGTSSWQAAEEVRPIPRELASLPEIRWGIRGLIALLIVGLAIVPRFLSEGQISVAGAVLIFAIVGVSLVVLTGWAGQVSLGQIAFFGVGAAVAGALATRMGWDISISIIAAGLAGAVSATIMGIPALRIRGLFLAVITFGFAFAASSYLLNKGYFGWWLPLGRYERPPLFGRVAIDSELRFYYLVLASFILSVVAVRGLRRSRTGRVLIGTRENERAMQAFGINVTRAKLTAFALSGFLAAFAGGLFGFHQQTLGINSFLPEESLAVFVMVVVGGLGSVPGALLGALWARGILYFLPVGFRFVTSGLGMVLMLMILPGGLGSLMYRLRDMGLKWVAKRRDILVPSLVADSAETRYDRTAQIAAQQFGRAGTGEEGTELPTANGEQAEDLEASVPSGSMGRRK
ncbi:MAG: ABC transporter permease subunit, partial [Acidimicrobiia bacterium]